MTFSDGAQLDPFRPLEGVEPRSSNVRTDDPTTSSGLRRQIAYANQVVDRGGEGEHPSHAGEASVPRLPHQPHRLQPTEGLLDSFALPLAQNVSRVPGGPSIDAAVARVLPGDVRRNLDEPKRLNEVPSVVGLVASQRHS